MLVQVDLSAVDANTIEGTFIVPSSKLPLKGHAKATISRIFLGADSIAGTSDIRVQLLINAKAYNDSNQYINIGTITLIDAEDTGGSSAIINEKFFLVVPGETMTLRVTSSGGVADITNLVATVEYSVNNYTLTN